MKNTIYLAVLILLSACNSSTSTKETTRTVEEIQPAQLSVQMADSEMKRMPDPRLLDFRDKPKWEYSNGLVCLAMFKTWQATGENRFLEYGKFYADSMITDNGKILTYKMSDFNIDRINPGRLLLELYKQNPNPKYKMAIDTLRKQMKGHPRTSEGGFWHKKRYPWQIWLDGLYMGSPFLTQYAAEYNEPELYDDVANQFSLVNKYMYNEETGLYFHGWDESREQDWANNETGLSPHFWGRAMGWFSMAVVDVLDNFPEDHPQRDILLLTAERIAIGIKKHQDQSTGVWWQILDMGGKEGNYLEASCSSMFTYFLLKAVANGYIDRSYLDVAKKAYEGIEKEFVVENEDGTISLTKICGVAGLGGNPYRDGSYEYYIGEPQRDNDPKGIGPFIMASLLMENLEE